MPIYTKQVYYMDNNMVETGYFICYHIGAKYILELSTVLNIFRLR